MTPRALAAALLAVALVLAGCDRLTPSGGPFKTVDVTGGGMGGDFRLYAPDGKVRTLADFRGKLVVMSFGFTHCPDVCPTTLADLARAMKELGGDASSVQVLFVTVDPKRDTPELLGQYVPAFNPSFIGLSGDEPAIAKVIKDFHVFAQVRPGKSEADYTVDHSAQIFVLDREGRLRLMMAPGTPPKDMASDLRVLLNS